MYYIVFSRNKNKSNGLTSNLYYVGTSKTAASDAFTATAASTLNITSAAGNLYFAGFKSDLEFIKEMKRDLLVRDIEAGSQPNRKEIINITLRNISLATCLNTLNTSGYKPKVTIVNECSECDDNGVLVKRNAYGNYLCNDCWTKYWDTRASLAEYVIGLANGTYKLDSFDETDIAAMVAAWKTNDVDADGEEIRNSSNKQKLINSEVYTEEELAEIEIRSGLTFEEEEEA